MGIEPITDSDAARLRDLKSVGDTSRPTTPTCGSLWLRGKMCAIYDLGPLPQQRYRLSRKNGPLGTGKFTFSAVDAGGRVNDCLRRQDVDTICWTDGYATPAVVRATGFTHYADHDDSSPSSMINIPMDASPDRNSRTSRSMPATSSLGYWTTS